MVLAQHLSGCCFRIAAHYCSSSDQRPPLIRAVRTIFLGWRHRLVNDVRVAIQDAQFACWVILQTAARAHLLHHAVPLVTQADPQTTRSEAKLVSVANSAPGTQAVTGHQHALRHGSHGEHHLGRTWRWAAARGREALTDAIGEVVASVTSDDALGWLQYAGYRPLAQAS